MRIRTVKPEMWTDEDMASISESANLLAIGLLNYADDYGYFNANELLIKAAIFPLRDPSTTIRRMLDELSEIGYIQLFEGTDGRNYGHICGFEKHQRVDRAKDSKIKGLIPFDEQSTNDRRHDSVGTGNREQGTGNREAPESDDSCSHQEIINIYHEILPTLPRVQAFTDKRKKYLKARLASSKNCQSLDWWRTYFEKVGESDFLMGRTQKPFTGCDFEWLITEGNFVKVVEGRYDNR